jgi:branched-chain amino acid transport system permease protein
MSGELDFLFNLLINGLLIGSVYSLICLSMVLIYKGSKVLNLAQGELLMLGGYLSYFFAVTFHLHFLLALFATMLTMSALGLLIERTILRPMIGENIIAVIMITLGLASVLNGVAGIFGGPDTRTLPQFFKGEAVVIGTFHLSRFYLATIGTTFLLVVLFFFFFKYSIYGIALRAAASDQLATMSMGISVKRIFGLCWAIAAFLSAFTGVMIGTINGINLGISMYGMLAFAPIILGGVDSIGGAILASFIIGIIESLSQGYLSSYVAGSIKEVTAFTIILVFMLFRPYGLFGTEEIERI